MKIVKRGIVYLIGLLIMALGVTISVKSGLGVTPVSSVPYVVSRMSGISLGMCTMAVYIVFILVQFMLLGKKFPIKNILQVIGSFLFGFLITWAQILTDALPPCSSYPLQLLYLLISIALIALGVLFYIHAGILSLPGEGVMEAVAIKFHMPLHQAKNIFDIFSVILAMLLSFACLGDLEGIREGTVIAALFVGRMMKLYRRLLKAGLMKFMEFEQEQPGSF